MEGRLMADEIEIRFTTNADQAARSVNRAAVATRGAERASRGQSRATVTNTRATVAANAATRTNIAGMRQQEIQANRTTWSMKRMGQAIRMAASAGGFSRLSPLGSAITGASGAGGAGQMMAGITAGAMAFGAVMKTMETVVQRNVQSLTRLAEASQRNADIQRQGREAMAGTAAGVVERMHMDRRRARFLGVDAEAQAMAGRLGGITGAEDAYRATVAAKRRGLMDDPERLALMIAERVAATGEMTATQAIEQLSPRSVQRILDQAQRLGGAPDLRDAVRLGAAHLVARHTGAGLQDTVGRMHGLDDWRRPADAFTEQERIRQTRTQRELSLLDDPGAAAHMRQQLAETFAPTAKLMLENYQKEARQLEAKQRIIEQEGTIVSAWLAITGRGTQSTRLAAATREFSESMGVE